jgi:KaiC/GvpD/RAD55 family RecA-like ATPase
MVDNVMAPTRNGGRPSLVLHRLDALPEPPVREEIVQGLLAAGEVSALVGQAGTGKSAIAQRLAICIAEGRPFLGRSVIPGPVIYVAAERSAGTARRLMAIRQKIQVPIYMMDARPNLSDLATVKELAALIRGVCERERGCPALIIIDTLARCMFGLDENSAKDMGRVMEGLAVLADEISSAAIVFLHHTGKNGDTRGSTALLGAIDLELQVHDRNDLKRLKVTKANSVAENQEFFVKLVPIEFRQHPNIDPETVIAAFDASPDDGEGDFGLVVDATPSRSALILSLIDELAVDGKVDRITCLSVARDRGIVKDPKPENGPEKALKNTAEQFRKGLVELKGVGLIRFDNSTISVGVGLPPHQPHAPP